MTEITYPSEKTTFGPWLLDVTQLQRLESVIENQMENLETRRKKLVSDELGKLRLKYPHISEDKLNEVAESSMHTKKMRKELRVKFKTDKTVTANSFKEIVINKEFENDSPISFIYKIECGDVAAEIKNDTFLNNRITFSVNTLAIEEARVLFYEFESWVKDVRPSLPVQIWRRVSAPLLILILSMLVLGSLLMPDLREANTKTLNAEAHKLLEKGINQDNMARAIEIILAIQSNYVKEPVLNMPKNSTYWSSQKTITSVSIIFVALVLLFPPNSIIGICNFEKKLRRWRSWIKIVTYFVPFVILIPILLNIITNKL